MTLSDSTMNGMRQVLTFGSAILAGMGIEGLDIKTTTTIANDLAVIVPAAVSLGSVAWSIWAHYKMKKVPIASTAVILPPVLRQEAKIGEPVDLRAVSTAKVVG
jgi:hypothetical protein